MLSFWHGVCIVCLKLDVGRYKPLQEKTMKKVILASALTIFCFAGNANALLWTEVVDLGGIGYGDDVIEWTHSTPADFEVPYDKVNSATIEISYSWIDSYSGEYVYMNGLVIGNLGINTDWVFTSDVFDVSASLNPFNNGDLLYLSLYIKEADDEWENDYWLGESTFELDYSNRTEPVPEPSTMLLMGAGALGLLGYGVKRSNKKG